MTLQFAEPCHAWHISYVRQKKDRSAEQEPKDLDAWIILKNVSILVTKSSIALPPPPPPPNRLNIEMFHLL